MKVNYKEENLRFSPEGEPRKIFVDIDETICFFPEKRIYELAVPNYENIEKQAVKVLLSEILEC